MIHFSVLSVKRLSQHVPGITGNRIKVLPSAICF
uniref:Uncharacterized protein n=1 Tax=Rhizophora mucronata TaxID=61149 RepID=A0A2P2PME4_RHIMU